MDEDITELDEELLELTASVVFEVGQEFPLMVSVPPRELDLILWVDVPEPDGQDIGGLLVDVPYLS